MKDDGLWRPRMGLSATPTQSLSRPASAPCLRNTKEEKVLSPPRSTRSTRSLLRKGGFSGLAEVKTVKTLYPSVKSLVVHLFYFVFVRRCHCAGTDSIILPLIYVIYVSAAWNLLILVVLSLNRSNLGNLLRTRSKDSYCNQGAGVAVQPKQLMSHRKCHHLDERRLHEAFWWIPRPAIHAKLRDIPIDGRQGSAMFYLCVCSLSSIAIGCLVHMHMGKRWKGGREKESERGRSIGEHMQCLLLWCCCVTLQFNPAVLEKLHRPVLAKPEGMWFLCPLGSGQLHAHPAAYLRDSPDDAGQVQPSIERELVPSISENGALFQCSWSSWQMCIPTQFGTFCRRIGCPNHWEGCLPLTSSWGVSKKFGSALWYGNLPCSGHWQISSEVSQFHLIGISIWSIPKLDDPWLRGFMALTAISANSVQSQREPRRGRFTSFYQFKYAFYLQIYCIRGIYLSHLRNVLLILVTLVQRCCDATLEYTRACQRISFGWFHSNNIK